MTSSNIHGAFRGSRGQGSCPKKGKLTTCNSAQLPGIGAWTSGSWPDVNTDLGILHQGGILEMNLLLRFSIFYETKRNRKMSAHLPIL